MHVLATCYAKLHSTSMDNKLEQECNVNSAGPGTGGAEVQILASAVG